MAGFALPWGIGSLILCLLHYGWTRAAAEHGIVFAGIGTALYGLMSAKGNGRRDSDRP
jgi:hypothetical protein